jgi:hypothetical protein
MMAESSEQDGTVFSAHLPRLQPTQPQPSL